MIPVTLNQYLRQQQSLDDNIDKQLCDLINSVAGACRQINYDVSMGALADVLGSLTSQNVQGETQKKLDVIANDIMLQANQGIGSLAGMASEEMSDVYPIAAQYPKGKYLLLFDPLDGSSNIDVNVSIGTIFSVLRASEKAVTAQATEQDFLQAGNHQVAAGYAVYGPQTLLVLSLGKGVVCFTLRPEDGVWLLTQENIQIPEQTSEFAINMSNMRHWEAPVHYYIQQCLQGVNGQYGKDYNMRWIASMVADVHRIMTRGGIFMYPRDTRAATRDGKLRLMYEANPMSFLVEQAGGLAIDGKQRILSVQPEALHQRIGVILGSRHEVERLLALHVA